MERIEDNIINGMNRKYIINGKIILLMERIEDNIINGTNRR